MDPCEKVELAGDFLNNWRDRITLKKVGKIHMIKLMVDRKKIFFKFIVDGEWLYSNDYLKAPDRNGNLNNYLDLRD